MFVGKPFFFLGGGRVRRILGMNLLLVLVNVSIHPNWSSTIWSNLKYFTNLDFREIRGFPFHSSVAPWGEGHGWSRGRSLFFLTRTIPSNILKFWPKSLDSASPSGCSWLPSLRAWGLFETKPWQPMGFVVVGLVWWWTICQTNSTSLGYKKSNGRNS